MRKLLGGFAASAVAFGAVVVILLAGIVWAVGFAGQRRAAAQRRIAS